MSGVESDPELRPLWPSPLCDAEDCYRLSPHAVGEYGCKASATWRCPPGGDWLAACPWHRPNYHRPGCGCQGIPERRRELEALRAADRLRA